MAQRPPAVSLVRRVLMVETPPEAAEQLTRCLADRGIASGVPPGGRGVIEKAVEVAPDMILLDSLLPDLSGWEVLTYPDTC